MTASTTPSPTSIVAASVLASATLVAASLGLASLGQQLELDVKLDVIHLLLLAVLGLTIPALVLKSSNGARSSSSVLVAVDQTTKNVVVANTVHTATRPSANGTAHGSADLSDTAAGDAPQAPAGNPYAHLKPALIAALVREADLVANPAGPDKEWIPVLATSSGDFAIEVHRKRNTDFCFRVVADMEGTPEEVFDILSDVTTRQTWDDICEGGGVVDVLSGDSRVQYMYTKGFWPTAPRDALVVGFVNRLPDGRYLNVTQSIESSPKFTPRAGSVTMKAALAGQIVGPDPAGRERMCKVVQIMDGDLGGWLPKSLVAMITTQAMPLSLRRVNKMLRKNPNHKTSSVFIEQAEGKRPVQITYSAPASSSSSKTSLSANGSATNHHSASSSGANGTVAAAKEKQQQPARPIVIAGVDVSPAVPALRGVRKVLEVAQPFMVAVVLLSVVFGRKRA
ncbi:hypothetical protein HK101_005612 [Irineochytrium annulatum]|nr:hypothetical protein HK101_005612 [Irineochytrium annulatum]